MKKVTLMLLLVISTISCEKKDENDQKPEMPDISVVDISNESDWNYAVLGQEDYFLLKTNGSRPEVLNYRVAQTGKDYFISFTNDGMIDQVIVDQYIFLFRNFDGNFVDIGIVYPNGEVEVLREIETEFNWNTLQSKASSETEAWSDVVRGAARVVAGVPCALSIAATIASGGAGIPIAAWYCGNFLLGLTADVLTNDFDIHNGFTDFVDRYGTVSTGFGCSSGDPAGCGIDAASMALHDLANHLEDIESNRQEEVELVSGALDHGYGDIQITLTWNNTADLDLHVVDPFGEEIFWQNMASASGGILDVDDIDGHGPENVFWPENQAPHGEYEVYVHHYVWDNAGYPQTSNFTVLINAFGRSRQFTGSTSLDEAVFVVGFDQHGFGQIKGQKIITLVKEK